jgi:hypothetical protein
MLAAALAAVPMMSASGMARTQVNGWAQPIQVSETGRFAWFPDITADASGRVHIAWSSGEDYFDTVMYATDPGGSSPASRQPVNVAAFQQAAPGDSAATRPGLVVDRSGILQLTYTDYGQIYLTQAYQGWASRPQAWSDPKTVNFDTSTYFSRQAVDSGGRLHLVFTQNAPTPDCVRCFHLYHRSSDDSGKSWSAPQDISGLETGSAKPQIIVDRQDNVHVVWESGFGGTLGSVAEPTQVLYAASYDRGNTWTEPYAFTTGVADSFGKMPAIAEDGEGKLVVVWRGEPEEVVYHQVSRDGGRSWSSPQRIPRVFTSEPVYGGGLDAYSMATDGAGNAHLVMSGRLDQDQRSLSILHLVWNGSSWSEPIPIVTYSNGDVPEWPRIVVGLGNQLHATWFTRDRANVFGADSGSADYRVWYSRGVADAPAATPMAYPTPAPTALPTVFVPVQQVQPTAPPISDVVPSASNAALATEMDDLAVIAISAAPVLALVGVGLLLLWRSKRR